MELNKGKEVMEYLRPNGGWVIYGEDFDSIQYFDGCEPIDKPEFDNALANIESILNAQQQTKTSQRQALLDKLGITEEEARLLLGGN